MKVQRPSSKSIKLGRTVSSKGAFNDSRKGSIIVIDYDMLQFLHDKMNVAQGVWINEKLDKAGNDRISTNIVQTKNVDDFLRK
jgi:hypothetical protein